MDLKIRDKVAIVTGASAGVGESVASELAQAGVKLVITARNDERLAKTAASIAEETGAEVVPFALDVTDPGSGEELVTLATEQFGGVDIVVNNAGRAHPGGLMEDSDDDWRKMEEVKLHAMIRLNRAAIPQMREQGWGASSICHPSAEFIRIRSCSCRTS